MGKPEGTVAKKNSLRRYFKETLRGTRLKMEHILILVTLDSAIINYYPFITVYYMVRKCNSLTVCHCNIILNDL